MRRPADTTNTSWSNLTLRTVCYREQSVADFLAYAERGIQLCADRPGVSNETNCGIFHRDCGHGLRLISKRPICTRFRNTFRNCGRRAGKTGRRRKRDDSNVRRPASARHSYRFEWALRIYAFRGRAIRRPRIFE